MNRIGTSIILTTVHCFTIMSSVAASEQVLSKSSCLFLSDYPDLSLDQAKEVLLQQAKRDAVSELFGERLRALTDIQNWKLNHDEITSSTAGIVRIKGDPVFTNGDNLGEICVEIMAFVKKKDLVKLEPCDVHINRFCYTNPNLSFSQIKSNAKLEAIKEMASQINAGLSKYPVGQISGLLHHFATMNEDFDVSTGVYCIDVRAEYIPLEVETLLSHSQSSTGISTSRQSHSGRNSYQLDLSAFDEGDLANPLGDAIIITVRDNQKCITGYSTGHTGRIEIPNLNLGSGSRVVIRLDLSNFQHDIIFESTTGEQFTLHFGPKHVIKFGPIQKQWQETNWKGKTLVNDLRFLLQQESAKLYINDKYVATTILPNGVTFSRLIIAGLTQTDFVFDISVSR